MRNCKEMQTYLNKMIFFPTCFVQFLIPLSWNHLLSELGRRFSKEDEKFTLKKFFFFCFQMLKALCHEICFWAFGEDNM